jgi:dTDP-4-dehydrorhamnose reductase
LGVPQSSSSSKLRIVIVGAGGRLGAALARAYAQEHNVVGLARADLDIGNARQIAERIAPLEFDMLINCAAQTNVDRCENQPEEAFAINAEAPRVLARICKDKGAKLIHFSTDYVFDGVKRDPYGETDVPHPISIYGESKLQGEKFVLETDERHLVVRVSWVFGPDRRSFIDQVIDRARQSSEVAAVADKFSTPTYTLDVADWLRRCWENNITGLLHLANDDECSWRQYAQHALDCCRQCGLELKGRHVAPLMLKNMTNFIARRPIYTVLSTEKFARLSGTEPRSWRNAVADYVTHHIVEHE